MRGHEETKQDEDAQASEIDRVHSVRPSTVDFCCVALKLIIEIDGDGHITEEARERDRLRDKILRFPGYAVICENGNAVQTIREFVQSEIATQSPSPPAPLPES